MNLQDIQAMIGNAVENFELEFKHGGELRNLDDRTKASIAKDSSAFANAGGGMLIYGIAEQKKEGVSVASAIEPVTNPAISVDVLTQIIRFGTSPALSKF